MEQKSFKTLEYDKILKMLSEFAKNDATRARIFELEPTDNLRAAEHMLAETDAAVTFILKYGSPEILRIEEIKEQLKRLKAGGVLNMAELLNIERILRNARLLKKLTPEQTGILSGYIEELTPVKPLEERIASSVLSDEELSDNASTELAHIRRRIKNASVKVKEILDGMTRSAHYKKFLQEAIVTMRNNRYVLPVKAEYRGEVKGIVHDMSASGGTVFIEPEGVVNANNELHELEIKERAEIERILSEISAECAEVCDMLELNFDTLIQLDFVFAKAKLAIEMKAVCPSISRSGSIYIKQGRHPLIDKNKVVPITVYLGDDFDSLIVTGPNTGGKTVVLKTLGLFCLMTQSGLHIPAADGSVMPVYDNVFADIGDEQSIEQSLSTFSAHMTNVVSIVNKVTPNSLVLFDELGAGTDPTEGAALAEAIIESIRGVGAKLAATTHYSELKVYAMTTEGVQNASCEFDVNTLSPTYRLLIGVPGKSNAFAIAEKLGLPKYIIDRSKSVLSEENIKFEDILTDIEQNRRVSERDSQEISALKKEAEDLKKQLEEERKKIEKQKDKIYDKARERADAIIRRAQDETEEMLAEFKAAQKEKDEHEALRAMADVKRRLGLKSKKNKPPINRTPSAKRQGVNINTLKPGTDVILNDLGDKGSVLSINKNDGTVLVQVGIMKVAAKAENISLVTEADNAKPSAKQTRTGGGSGGGMRAGGVKPEVDLRGMMLEEALMETDKYLDEAAMAGLTAVSIIHGKGTGTLRAGVQNMLKKHPHVKSFRLGRYGEGENGVTIVEIK